VPHHFPNWYDDREKPWLGTDREPGYIHDEHPDILGINGDNNEGYAFDPRDFVGIYEKIRGWEKQPGLFFWLSWPKSDGNNADINSTAIGSAEYFGQFVRGFCRIKGVPLLDLQRLGIIAQYGFDPAARNLARREDVPLGVAGEYPVRPPWTAPLYTYDWGCRFLVHAQPTETFASWGNELRFVIGGDKDGAPSLFRLGYNAATGRLRYRQDATEGLTIIPETESGVAIGGDTSPWFLILFYVLNEQVYVAYESQQQPGRRHRGTFEIVFSGPVARLGGPFQPKVDSASGGGAALFVERDPAWKSAFAASAMDRFWIPRIVDCEISGRQPAAARRFNEFGYNDSGAIGGDGTNHPTTFYHQNFVRPLIEAQFWGL